MDLFGLRDLLLIFLVFAPLERLLPIHGEQKLLRPGVVTDLLHYCFSGFLIKAGILLLLLGATRSSGAVVPEAWRLTVAGLPLWLQTSGVIVVADLGFYLAHRMFHAVPLLWRFHAVHHSIERMDWLAAHRVHPVDQIVTKSVSLIPVFAAGFSETAIGLFAVLYHWQSLLIHSNFRIRFGPLRWILASPQFHHWHHADAREAFDRNFAGQLPIWDMLFGTLYLPRGRMPDGYGVDDPVPPDWPGQLAYPFRAASGAAAQPRPGARRAGAGDEGAEVAGVVVEAGLTAGPVRGHSVQ